MRAKTLKAAAACLVAAAAIILGGRYFQASLEQRRARSGVEEVVRALLKGDYATLERYQFGPELDRAGLTRAQLERYRVNLLSGYLSPDARITVAREKLTLPAARTDYERNMQNQIRQRWQTSPKFNVTIKRADGRGNIQFPIYAMRGAKGWVVSPMGTLSFLETVYSRNPIERYAHIAAALRKSGLDRVRTPSGSWMTVERIEQFVAGKITEKDIFR